MFWPNGPSSYPRPIIMLYPFRTTFPLFAVPSVPPGIPIGTSVLRMTISWFQLIPSLGLWSSCSQRCRRLEVPLFRLRIDHTSLKHGHLMAREAPPICCRCQVRHSVFHALVECYGYSVPRNRLFPSLTSVPPRERLSLLLSESSTSSSSTIFAFLRVSGLISDF